MTTLPFLPYGRQAIDDDDIRAVAEVLRGDWLTTGPAVASLEKALCDALHCTDAAVVANGTAALHLALQALGVGEGDAVVVPTVTFLATANAARYVGAEVVFADVDPASGLLTEESCRAAIDRSTLPVRAIMPVHLGGRMVDMAAIGALARERGAFVVEDACHALGGAHLDGKGTRTPAGSCRHADAATFSFHPVKAITCGEGGAVACRDAALAERIRCLRSHGMERNSDSWRDRDLGFENGAPNPWYYEMHEPGWNYRITDMQCALAESQLRKLDAFVEKRRALAAHYDSVLAPLANRVRPPLRDPGYDSGWHLYQVAIDFAGLGTSRREVMGRLHEQGIGSQVHYIPVHRQPYYRDRDGDLTLPGADRFYETTLSLPLYPGMEIGDVERVADALRDATRTQDTRVSD